MCSFRRHLDILKQNTTLTLQEPPGEKITARHEHVSTCSVIKARQRCSVGSCPDSQSRQPRFGETKRANGEPRLCWGIFICILQPEDGLSHETQLSQSGSSAGHERTVTYNLALSPPSPACQPALLWLTWSQRSSPTRCQALYNLALAVYQG